nr:hypothetical protein [Actinomycetota bacterium]
MRFTAKRKHAATLAGIMLVISIIYALPAHATTLPKYASLFFGRTQYEAATGGSSCTQSGGAPAPSAPLGGLKTFQDVMNLLAQDQLTATGGVVTGPTFTSTTSTRVCNGAVLYPTWSDLQGLQTIDNQGGVGSGAPWLH